jgi:hypothetical protein
MERGRTRNVRDTYGLDDGGLDHVGRNGDSSGGHF